LSTGGNRGVVDEEGGAGSGGEGGEGGGGGGGGVFLEMGAGDGVLFSNSLLFEVVK